MGWFCLSVLLVALNLFLIAAEQCMPYSETSCSICTEDEQCYWCESTQQCRYWETGYLPRCKGENYYYRQCDVNGLSFWLIFSIALLLVLLAAGCCCVCCCCCYCRRRRRREYHLMESSRPGLQEQQVNFEARRNEIRLQYGLDSNEASLIGSTET